MVIKRNCSEREKKLFRQKKKLLLQGKKAAETEKRKLEFGSCRLSVNLYH